MNEHLAGKRLLVVEDAVRDSLGHWYEYVRSVIEMNRGQGVDAVAVTHAKIDPTLAHEIGAIAAFSRSNWSADYDDSSRWRAFVSILQHNWLVYRTMSRILRERGPVDCIFAPTVWLHHVWGWRLLMARHGSRIGRMVLFFRMDPGTKQPITPVPTFARSMAIMKWAMRSFSSDIARGKLIFATDSTRLAGLYGHLCGCFPEVFPSPRIAPFPEHKRPAKKPGEAIVLSSLGPPRFEKGIDLLQRAIKACFAKGFTRPVKFVIQWNLPIATADGKTYEPDAELLADPRVEFITGSLDSEAYDAAIAASDCILLPYERAAYYARISGVAVEAATAGIPMIYTHDTWNSDLVDSCGAGVPMDDGDLVGLTNAIHAIVDRYDEFSALAIARSTEARRIHSSAAFMTKLWGPEPAHV